MSVFVTFSRSSRVKSHICFFAAENSLLHIVEENFEVVGVIEAGEGACLAFNRYKIVKTEGGKLFIEQPLDCFKVFIISLNVII